MVGEMKWLIDTLATQIPMADLPRSVTMAGRAKGAGIIGAAAH